MEKARIALVVTCLSLLACYDFDFPLDPKPQVAVDARLVGAWRCLGRRRHSTILPGCFASIADPT